jgi:hypothetical protein
MKRTKREILRKEMGRVRRSSTKSHSDGLKSLDVLLRALESVACDALERESADDDDDEEDDEEEEEDEEEDEDAEEADDDEPMEACVDAGEAEEDDDDSEVLACVGDDEDVDNEEDIVASAGVAEADVCIGTDPEDVDAETVDEAALADDDAGAGEGGEDDNASDGAACLDDDELKKDERMNGKVAGINSRLRRMHNNQTSKVASALEPTT